MSDHDMKPCLCPGCGCKMDKACSMDPDDATPQPGDVTICLECGMVMRWGPDMTLAQIRREDFAAMSLETLKTLLAVCVARDKAVRAGIIVPLQPGTMQ